MQIGLDIGRDHLELDVPEDRLIRVQRQPASPSLLDPAEAVRAALETPIGFPALRRALTPDDHIAIVVDEHLPCLARLLVPILEHVTAAGVAPGSISLVCPSSTSNQEWLEELPDAFEEVHLEIHNPADRKGLSYLATTRRGKRLYLNRTVVDADQVVVLAGVGYDPLLGYSGSEGALYPALSDEKSRQDAWDRLSSNLPAGTPWPIRQEAAEVAWLLGAPFFVHVIEGPGDSVVHVIGGPADTSAEAQRLHNVEWRGAVARPADTVVAALTGDPARHGFADLAIAAACASRVVKPRGRMVLLTAAAPVLGAGVELLRQAEDPVRGLSLLRENKPLDTPAAFLWASAAQHAQIILLERSGGRNSRGTLCRAAAASWTGPAPRGRGRNHFGSQRRS